MNLKRLKELSAAGFPVALAPDQMLEIISELEALQTQVVNWRTTAEAAMRTSGTIKKAAHELDYNGSMECSELDFIIGRANECRALQERVAQLERVVSVINGYCPDEVWDDVAYDASVPRD